MPKPKGGLGRGLNSLIPQTPRQEEPAAAPDRTPQEEAAAYRSLVDEFALKHEEIAARVGKSRGAVANSVRLLKLPPPVQESLALGLITEGHARAILQVPSEEEQLRLTEHTV